MRWHDYKINKDHKDRIKTDQFVHISRCPGINAITTHRMDTTSLARYCNYDRWMKNRI